jgi:hypothetical protein
MPSISRYREAQRRLNWPGGGMALQVAAILRDAIDRGD